MGEVYRALDTRLNRQVAVKVLPAALAGDPERIRRLQREAQLLASLNHPHIATIHGLEEFGGTFGLVMELVEGEDLRQRIARGPIALDEALSITRQIALALEAAHGQGIIHRDLKPANIKVRNDGAVKVLDFGLAKVLDSGRLSPEGTDVPNADDSPTLTSPATMTTPGVILGTAAYMSPEQARGYAADKRSDIWAFGGVLYEMLTGRSAFPGATITDTLASVLQREPDWNALPAGTPVGVHVLLRRCLEKDSARRLHDIADARIEIDDARSGARDVAMVTTPWPRRRTAVTWGLTISAVVLAASTGWLLRPVPSPPEMRLEIGTPPTIDSTFALSPDGRTVAFVSTSSGPMRLWLRSLDNTIARPLPGTEHATLPFWSPDGQSIGFFGDTKLKRVDIDGGSVRTLASGVAVPIGGTWGPDGTILFASNPGGPIERLADNGGEPAAVTRVEAPNERGHFFPQFLPGGRRFLFYMSGNPELKGIYVGELEGGRKTRLFDADGPALYVEPGYLVFRRGTQLLARRFDADRASLAGDVFTLGDGLNGQIGLSASRSGTIGYRVFPGDSGQRQLVWLDRSGRELERVVYDGSAAQGPALSHDGRFVGVFRFANGNMDLWSYDRKREFWDRLTFDPGDDIYLLWSPDDRSIIYAGVRNAAPLGMYTRLLSAAPESERLLLKSPGGEFPADWSADGRYLLFGRYTPTREADIYALSLANPAAEPFEVVATDANEGLPQFSPDGKWVAYQSDRLGREEIYLRPFPGPGADIRVSSEGGNQARWHPNGEELFYIGADDRMMAVSVATRADGTVDVGKPAALFPTDIGSTVRLKYRQQYMVAPDGTSFVLNSTVDRPSTTPVVLIMNWSPGR